jgi:hypothetical protein
VKRSIDKLLLGGALVLLAGCARQPAAARGPAPNRLAGAEQPLIADTLHQPATQGRPVARVLVMPAGGSASEPATGGPPLLSGVPTAAYASLEAARDSIGAIVSRSFSHADTSIHVSREAVTFDYVYAKTKTPGWAFHVVVTDTSCPFMSIQKALTAAGWVEHYGYTADGADGSNAGFLCLNFFCLVEGTWQGEDGSDSTFVPEPGCQVVVTCVPRREDDFPPR